MKNDFYQVSLKLILKNKSGEILILKAVGDGTYAGFYDFPGGRIRRDEFETSIVEVLKREVVEEIGAVDFEINQNPVAYGRHSIPAMAQPRSIAAINQGEDIHVLYLFFEGNFLDGNIVISKEHTDYKWVKLEDLELEKYFKSGILEGIKMYLKN